MLLGMQLRVAQAGTGEESVYCHVAMIVVDMYSRQNYAVIKTKDASTFKSARNLRGTSVSGTYLLLIIASLGQVRQAYRETSSQSFEPVVNHNQHC